MPGEGTHAPTSRCCEAELGAPSSVRAAEKEQQLERYAADLRETFKHERERAQELRRSYMATVRALCNAVEARDAYTGKHAERVAAYGLEIARGGRLPLADDPEVEFGFLLHDVGKVAVPDAILLQARAADAGGARADGAPPGRSAGRSCARSTSSARRKLVVRHHHERWDGAGYPDGLAGEEIPLAARVFSVADTLDALTTDRPYRPASPFAEARDDDRRRRGHAVRPRGRRRVRARSRRAPRRIRAEVG